MSDLNDLVREYCSILDQERQLKDRKERLREAIATEMGRQGVRFTRSAYGSAERASRFKLLPRRESVLGVLSSENIFPFTNFTPARVKELLVPKYGRETLIPLFDIEKTEFLLIKRARGGY
jgi:hypothetical protein